MSKKIDKEAIAKEICKAARLYNRAPLPAPGKRTFGMTKEALYRHYENKL